MAKFCKTRVPAAMAAELAPIKDDEEAVKAFGLAFGVRMCKQLLAAGAVGLHFYTLNSSILTGKICDQLGFVAIKEDNVEEDKSAEVAVAAM